MKERKKDNLLLTLLREAVYFVVYPTHMRPLVFADTSAPREKTAVVFSSMFHKALSAQGSGQDTKQGERVSLRSTIYRFPSTTPLTPRDDLSADSLLHKLPRSPKSGRSSQLGIVGVGRTVFRLIYSNRCARRLRIQLSIVFHAETDGRYQAMADVLVSRDAH